jgi:hypothetical protein
METKLFMQVRRVTLAEVMNKMEVLDKRQLKQIKGGDNDPVDPTKK